MKKSDDDKVAVFWAVWINFSIYENFASTYLFFEWVYFY